VYSLNVIVLRLVNVRYFAVTPMHVINSFANPINFEELITGIQKVKRTS